LLWLIHFFCPEYPFKAAKLGMCDYMYYFGSVSYRFFEKNAYLVMQFKTIKHTSPLWLYTERKSVPTGCVLCIIVCSLCRTV